MGGLWTEATWIGIMVFGVDMGWLLFGEDGLDIVLLFCVNIDGIEEELVFIV